MDFWICDGFLDSRWVPGFTMGFPPKGSFKFFVWKTVSQEAPPPLGTLSEWKLFGSTTGSPTWLHYRKCSKPRWPSTLRIKYYSWSKNGTEVAAQSLMLCAVRVTVICKGKRIEGRAPARPWDSSIYIYIYVQFGVKGDADLIVSMWIRLLDLGW